MVTIKNLMQEDLQHIDFEHNDDGDNIDNIDNNYIEYIIIEENLGLNNKDYNYIVLPYVQVMSKLFNQIDVLDLSTANHPWFEYLSKSDDISSLSFLHDRKAILFQRLMSLKSETFDIVLCFDRLDRLSLAEVRKLIDEAHRILKPHGLLLMTGRCLESFIVLTNKDVLSFSEGDRLPKQSKLIERIVKKSEFTRSKIEYFNQDWAASNEKAHSLERILLGACKNYSLIAQKKGWLEEIEDISQLFNRKTNYDLVQLIRNFDQRLEKIYNELEILQSTIPTIYNSSSWRLTAPMRELSLYVKNTKTKLNKLIKIEKNDYKKIRRIENKNIFHTQKEKAIELLFYLIAFIKSRPRIVNILRIFFLKLPVATQERLKEYLHLDGHKRNRKRQLKTTPRGEWIFEEFVRSLEKSRKKDQKVS